MFIPLKRGTDHVATDKRSYKCRVSSGGIAISSPPWQHSRLAVSCPPDLRTDKLRQKMLADMQERVAEVDWDYFMKYLLPPLHNSISMEKVMANLVRSKDVVTRNGQLRWAAFADGTPSTEQLPENKVFKVVKQIATASGASSEKTERRSAQIVCNPTITPISDTRDNLGKPDAYFMFNHRGSSISGGTPRWRDIAVPAEFKKDDDQKAVNDNATQLLWSLNHIMREDARRRFALGFTIEDANLRIWFASRSHILASFAINFLTEIDRIAEFFLRVMWADVRDLGIDDTIRLTGARDAFGGVQYEIDVDGKTYRTKRLISSIGAEWIRGRGTRVWEVRELDENGDEGETPLVLKDAWVDHGRLREPEILRQIRASARNQGDTEAFDTFLLHVSHSGDVLAKGQQPDDTHAIICRGGKPAPKRYLVVKKDIKSDATVPVENLPKGAIATDWAPQEKLITYPRRVHHRTVFVEVCETILEAKTLKDAFEALKDVIGVLGILHACGWVHRDVSVGNILIHDDTGKLSDLEFAKRDTDTSTHDVRTGTAYYMAVEIQDGDYQFSESALPTPQERPASTESSVAATMIARRQKKQKLHSEDEHANAANRAGPSNPFVAVAQAAPSKPTCIVPFRHNPLHDLESVLWVSWYLLSSTKVPQFEDLPGCDWATYMLARYNLSAKLFTEYSFRCKVISPNNTRVLTKEVAKLHPVFQSLFNQLERFCVALGRRYRDAELAAEKKAQEWTEARVAARARGEAVSDEEHAPTIPFTVAEDSPSLYHLFLDILDEITSDQNWHYLHINGTPIKFEPRSILLAEQIQEMKKLETLAQAEQTAALAVAASRNDAQVPETPRAPKTLKRKMEQD